MTYWAQVSDRLVQIFTAAVPTGVVVFDGKVLHNNNGRSYVQVGQDRDGDAGSLSFSRSTVGNTLLAETGTVLSEIVGQSGNDPKAARDEALAIAQTLALAVAADHTLGVLPTGSQCAVDVDVRALSGNQGAAQVLSLQVTYTTII